MRRIKNFDLILLCTEYIRGTYKYVYRPTTHIVGLYHLHAPTNTDNA